jgi:hypothetical protein
VEYLVIGEGVEPSAQGGEVTELGDVLVQPGEFGQRLGDVFGMRLDVVDGTEALKGAQHPQVSQVVVATGEVEQPKAVADRERVEVQRCLRGLGQ